MKKGNEIIKPMSVMRAEFINSLADLINTSSLPPFVLESILKDMYADVKAAAQRQLELDYQRYKSEVGESENNQ